MDGKPNLDCNWEIEDIPDHAYLFRQATSKQRVTEGNRRFPNEAFFTLREGEDGLSCNWDKYSSIKDSFILIGLRFNSRQQYLDYKSFKIFKLSVGFLKSIEGITVIHKPEFNGNPAPIGRPNNKSHSEICYLDDVEIRTKLSDYSRENDCYCDFDINSLEKEILALREKLNDTAYHKN